MAAALQQRQKERDEAERKLLNRAMQQTSVAAVGQCALTNHDLEVIFEQAVYRVAEMLAVEYAMLFQRLPDGRLHPLAVYGLAPEDRRRHHVHLPANHRRCPGRPTPARCRWSTTGARRNQFDQSPLLAELGVVSGVAVAIPTRGKPFGVLAAHSTHKRDFSAGRHPVSAGGGQRRRHGRRTHQGRDARRKNSPRS